MYLVAAIGVALRQDHREMAKVHVGPKELKKLLIEYVTMVSACAAAAPSIVASANSSDRRTGGMLFPRALSQAITAPGVGPKNTTALLARPGREPRTLSRYSC